MQNHQLCIGTIGEGAWRSRDGGLSFERLREGLFVECHVRALTSHSTQPNRLFMGTEDGLYTSDDHGDQWRQIDSPLSGQQIWSLLVLPSDPNVILAGTCPSRIFRSDDGGMTWQEANVIFQKERDRIRWTRVTTLRADPVEPKTVWAGVEIDGAWRSDDAGLNWTPCREGLSSQDIHDIAVVDTPQGKKVIAGTDNDLNVSTDNGQSWRPLGMKSLLPFPYFRGLCQKVDERGTILVGNGDGPPGTVGTVGYSKDGGETWQAADFPNVANSTIWTFAAHQADANLIYAVSVHGEIYRSNDGGEKWIKLEREFGEIRAALWTPVRCDPL